MSDTGMFILAMFVLYGIIFIFVTCWYLSDTKELRRLKKLSKKENKK